MSLKNEKPFHKTWVVEETSLRIENHFINVNFIAAEKPKKKSFEEEAVSSITSNNETSQHQLDEEGFSNYYLLYS